MRYIIQFILTFYSLSIFAGPVKNLDLTIPEQPAVHIPEKEFFFNWGDYYEPPTKAQQITFWTLNVLDVYLTHDIMKQNFTYERNPLLPSKPRLEELILHKAILVPLLSKHSSKRYMTGLNVILTYTVIRNYELYN